MAEKLTIEDRLSIISRAWGKQNGWVFFPWIAGDAEDKRARIQSYHEGPAFKWPKDRQRIVDHLKEHRHDDVYWCPSIFENRIRRADLAMDEHALWADLDAKDPHTIEDYPPTVAWETSPNRYQALWLITAGDIQGASWPGQENQRLTYHIGADPSGWDTTQLLRIPDWRNHKPEYRNEEGRGPRGKLLWKNGRRYLPDDFEDLPQVEAHAMGGELVDALADEVERVDRHEIWGKYRLKLPKTARELVAAKVTGGEDRSEKLWWLMRCLADVGVSSVEIVAVLRPTVWNKFEGRNDELKRLLTEATKAVNSRSQETKDALEAEGGEYPEIVNLFEAVAKYDPPKWLVEDLIADESVGFIAGQPKSFKTWFGLDLAISVATGAEFLEYFRVTNPGPVLYVQAEDGPALIKQRVARVLPNKRMDRVRFLYEQDEDISEEDSEEATLVWEPPQEGLETPKIATPDPERMDDPPIISDPGWQSWLDDVLSHGYGQEGEPYRMVILDPLMMMAGDVEENRAHAMTSQIYKPLLLLARKHHLALLVVHHMRKVSEEKTAGARGGQLMLGSVANHAWSQNSLYVTHGRYNSLMMETESKFAPGERYQIKNLRSRRGGKDTWEPHVELANPGDERGAQTAKGRGKGTVSKKAQGSRKDGEKAGARGRPRDSNPPALRALKLLVNERARTYTTHEVKDKLAEMIGKAPTQTIYLQAYQQLKKCWEHGQVKRVGKNWITVDAEHDEAEELVV
jgi:hypothetical protein